MLIQYYKNSMKELYQNLPETPGVYLMKNQKGAILYIGKAGNLRRRVSSYFLKSHSARLEKLVSEINKIDFKKTDSALEALILESELIKKHQPIFNILEKDDKSFLYLVITKEKYPRLILVRGKDLSDQNKLYLKIYGPFLSARDLREAIKLLRQIFTWNTHDQDFLKSNKNKPCFDFQIGNCPGVCSGAITEVDYKKIIKKITLFLAGKKKKVLSSLKLEMKKAAKQLEFEKAGKLRRQIFGLEHINDIALIGSNESNFKNDQDSEGVERKSFRIEGYDISNISGTSAVGSMVVFTGQEGNFQPNKSAYRKFKIYSVSGPDDTGMIKEVLIRRLRHPEWTLPDLILIDGGVGQVNAARSVLKNSNLKIPILGIAKGVRRKRNDIIGVIPSIIKKTTLIQVRDEAHRFAITYHKKLRSEKFKT